MTIKLGNFTCLVRAVKAEDSPCLFALEVLIMQILEIPLLGTLDTDIYYLGGKK